MIRKEGDVHRIRRRIVTHEAVGCCAVTSKQWGPLVVTVSYLWHVGILIMGMLLMGISIINNGDVNMLRMGMLFMGMLIS